MEAFVNKVADSGIISIDLAKYIVSEDEFKEFDLKPGGKWSFIMHGPDKGNYANECVFISINKPNLIAWYRVSKPLFKVVASFESVGPDRTKVIFKMLFDSAEECNKLKGFAPEKNEENLDKLEDELQMMSGKK